MPVGEARRAGPTTITLWSWGLTADRGGKAKGKSVLVTNANPNYVRRSLS